MTNVLIVNCAKVRDAHCVACMKCFKAVDLKEGEFARYDSVKIVAMSSCGDCPGLVMPKVGLTMDLLDYMERDVDAIHLGTCMVIANKTAGCTLDLEKIQELLVKKYGVPVILGTHNY